MLLALPMAIAAPSGALVERAPPLEARSDDVRFTHFDLYSDTGCKNILFRGFTIGWTGCCKGQSPELPNGATFGSAVWTGGSNAQQFNACQFGHSCTDERNEILQNPGACSGGGGRRFNKIQVIP